MAGIKTNVNETSYGDVTSDDLIRIWDVSTNRLGYVAVEDIRNMADFGTQTATATAGAATLNKLAGVITSEALTTAAAAEYTLTVTDSTIAATDIVLASVQNGTNTGGTPVLTTVAPGSGSVVIKVKNDHATVAFNGTIKVSFRVVKI